VMGISNDFGMAYAKAQMAANNNLPLFGKVLISIKDVDKVRAVDVAGRLHKMGFEIVATKGTHAELAKNKIPSERALKITEGRPNIVDSIINDEIDLIINTTVGKQSILDSFSIRRSAIDRQVPYVTTIRGALAVAKAIEALKSRKLTVKPIQLYH
jgi:carbamoyl-phosphate synthase large subunit